MSHMKSDVDHYDGLSGRFVEDFSKMLENEELDFYYLRQVLPRAEELRLQTKHNKLYTALNEYFRLAVEYRETFSE